MLIYCKKKIQFLWQDTSPCGKPQSSNSCHWIMYNTDSQLWCSGLSIRHYFSKISFRKSHSTSHHIPHSKSHIPKASQAKNFIFHIFHIPYSIFRKFLSQPINGIHISTGRKGKCFTLLSHLATFFSSSYHICDQFLWTCPQKNICIANWLLLLKKEWLKN